MHTLRSSVRLVFALRLITAFFFFRVQFMISVRHVPVDGHWRQHAVQTSSRSNHLKHFRKISVGDCHCGGILNK